MERYINKHRVAFALLIMLTVVGLFAGCSLADGENANGSTLRTTIPTVETTVSTTENTTTPTVQSSTEPTTTPTTTETPKETTPLTTKPTDLTSGSTNNRKTLYGYDTTTGRTVPGEIVSEHAGYADLENLIAWDGV